LREVKEETGLTLNSYTYCGIVTFVSDIWETEYMHIFHSEDFSGTVKECDEGNLEWVEIKELYNLLRLNLTKCHYYLPQEEKNCYTLKSPLS
jgi:8-oxo-dGTP diphosphatase